MLFFKELLEEKLNTDSFKQAFKKECNICSITVKVVSLLEQDRAFMKKVLNDLDIRQADYEDLLNADKCNPDMVLRVCDYLNMDHQDYFKNCPKK